MRLIYTLVALAFLWQANARPDPLRRGLRHEQQRPQGPDRRPASARALNVFEDGSSSSSPSFCKSIIAIGNTRVPSSDPQHVPRSLQHVDHARLPPRPRGLSNGADPAALGEEAGATTTTLLAEVEGDEDFVCELYGGITVPISASPEQLTTLRKALNNGELISAVSTIQVVPGAEDDAGGAGEGGGTVGMKPAPDEGDPSADEALLPPTAPVSLPPGPIVIRTDPNRRLEHERRRLATYVGDKPMLIIRVTDSAGEAVPGDAHTVSDKFFGTYNDDENMKSQFASCSYGSLNIVNSNYGITPQESKTIEGKLQAPGVLDVSIDLSLDNPQHLIRGAVTTSAQEKLGFALPGPFAHVLIVVARCVRDCGWAAYAYVNSWLSVYQGGYYAYPAVQMHEVGHNLNLAHSGGLDGQTYTDHTCLMGNPLFSDTAGDMCFNPAKSYQIAMASNDYGSGNGNGNWYNKDRVEMWDPEADPSDGGAWSGKLVGVAEYRSLSSVGVHAGSRLVLKLEDSKSDTDLYVGFNRAVGINSDNKQGSDKVTVVEAGGNGMAYSQSMLKAALAQGESYVKQNWRSGEDLVVTINLIRTDVVPGYAEVTVKLGNRTPKPPTPPPTLKPTLNPTNKPIVLPTPNPSNLPTQLPTKFPTMLPTQSPTKFPTRSPTSSPNPKTRFPTYVKGDIEFRTEMYIPNRVGEGILFTIQALDQMVTITSLSTYTYTKTHGTIEVYTRPGHYVGYTSSDEGWTLIFNQTVNPLGLEGPTLLDIEKVDIPVGDSASFYVYAKQKLSYQYSDTWTEGNEVLNDGILRMYAGLALAYGRWEGGCEKGVSLHPDGLCIFTPRVFSGIVEYSLPEVEGGSSTNTASVVTKTAETTSSVPALVFSAPNWNNAQSSVKGLMFTVEAKQNITIQGLSIVSRMNTFSNVLIYTVSGLYNGRSSSPDGWDLVYEGTPDGRANEEVRLDNFTQAIRAGETASFYVYTRSGQIYTAGDVEGNAYGSDDAIVIHEGLATKSFFRRPAGVGQWAGVLRYSLG